jgi:hypothetical protein
MSIIEMLNDACKEGASQGLRKFYEEHFQKKAAGEEYQKWLEERVAFLTEMLIKKLIKE